MSEGKFQLNFNMKLGGGILLILMICILSAYSIILSWDIHCLDPDRLITISKGSSAQSVATLLKKESCLQNETIFKLALTLTMKTKKIRSGRYNLKGISSVGQLVNVITSPSSDRVKVTLIEGWSLEHFADELKNKKAPDRKGLNVGSRRFTM